MPVHRRPRSALIAAFGVSIAVVTFASPASAAPYTSQPTISVSDQTPEAGSRLRVCGRDFHARTRVVVTLDERRLARVRTKRSGAFCTTVRIPSGASGPHQIVATDRKGASASVLVNIVACRDDDDDDRGDRDGRSGRGDRGDRDDRGRGNEGCDNDHDGRDSDGDGRDKDRDGRDKDSDGRDKQSIRAAGVSSSSALPVRVAGVRPSEGTSGLAVAEVIGISALLGTGLLLFTGRRRKAGS